MALPIRPRRYNEDARPDSRDKFENPQAPISGEDFLGIDEDLLSDIKSISDSLGKEESDSIVEVDSNETVAIAEAEDSESFLVLDENEAEGSTIGLIDVEESVNLEGVKQVEDEFLSPQKRLDAFEHVLDSELALENQTPELLEGKGRRVFSRSEPVKQEKVKVTNFRGAHFGGISAKFAIEGNYEIYAHLEDKIHDMVEQIQETISEQGDAERVGMARRQRGSELYFQMYQKIDRLVTRALSSSDGIGVEPIDSEYFTAAVNNEILGFGPLEPLWQDKEVSEVMVNGPYEVRVETRGKTRIATGIRFRDADHAMKVTNNFLALSGRSFSTKMPYADGSLPDGSRLNAIHTEIAPKGPLLTIRRFPDTIFSMEKLVNIGSMDSEMATLLGNYVHMGISIVVAGGTGTGKALCITTPIPTPAGLIPLGELRVGDTVFDENGKLTTITGFYPQGFRPSYKLTFSDNSVVVADAEHNWQVSGMINNKFYGVEGVVKTTAQLVENFTSNDISIQLTKPVQYTEQELPMDPYLLGFWLSCGNASGLISGENRDVEDILVEKGIKFKRVFDIVGSEYVVMLEIEGFRQQLLDFGLLSDDNATMQAVLPEAYLIASEGQRRAVLAGILDNGAILHRRHGYVEFIVSDNDVLATQIIRLASSLGVSVKRQELTYNDSTMTALVFETDEQIFQCEGLVTAHKKTGFVPVRSKKIVSIEPIGNVDVACISVDSPNSLYLFGNEHTVTHNTSMLNALSGCIPNDQRIITVEDTMELQLHPDKHVLGLRSRPANPKGEDAITIRDLVRNTLRMRPDRIIVGEVRDASAYDMMQALNTGHDGSLTTTHASNPHSTVERLALLTSEAGEVTPERALSLIAGAVDLIVNIERYPEDGSRRVASVSEIPSTLDMKDGRLVLEPKLLWRWTIDSYDEENNKLHGHYEKVSDISESLTREHSIDKRQWLTLEEIYKLSKVPEINKDAH